MRALICCFVIGCGGATPGARATAPHPPTDVAATTVRVDRTSYRIGEAVEVVLSGAIMLTGACNGATPLVGVERQSADGATWTTVSQERVQLDCGPAAADWRERHVVVPWPPLREALTPGTYRLVFWRRSGDAWIRLESSSFDLRP